MKVSMSMYEGVALNFFGILRLPLLLLLTIVSRAALSGGELLTLCKFLQTKHLGFDIAPALWYAM